MSTDPYVSTDVPFCSAEILASRCALETSSFVPAPRIGLRGVRDDRVQTDVNHARERKKVLCNACHRHRYRIDDI